MKFPSMGVKIGLGVAAVALLYVGYTRQLAESRRQSMLVTVALLQIDRETQGWYLLPRGLPASQIELSLGTDDFSVNTAMKIASAELISVVITPGSLNQQTAAEMSKHFDRNGPAQIGSTIRWLRKG